MNVQIECPCPEKAGAPRHPNGDTVVLRDKLDFVRSMTVRNTVRVLRLEGANPAQALAGITEAYLLVGIESWTLQDEKGTPRPIDNETIRDHLLSHIDQAVAISDVADDLYQKSVMLPLLKRDYGFSPPTPTEPTSPTDGTEPKPHKLPKRSSTTTSPTDDTEVISPSLVGVSNSSQSSQSAA